MSTSTSWAVTLLRGLRAIVAQNLGYKLASLVMALLLWTWVQGQQVVEQTTWINVEYKLPEDKVLNQEPISRVRATVRGTQVQIRELRRKHPSLLVDLSEFPVGVQSLDFLETEIQELPKELEVVALAPNTLQVELEPRALRTVKVEVVTTGELPAGFRVRNMRVSPEKVVLAGPKSILEKLDSIPTQPLPLDGLTRDATLDVNLALRPRTLSMAEPKPLKVEIQVEEVTLVRSFPGVPVTSRSRAWTPELDTVEVVLTGPSRSLEALKAENVTVLVIVPDGTTGKRVVANDDETEGAYYLVHHEGPADVSVSQVKPSRIPMLAIPQE